MTSRAGTYPVWAATAAEWAANSTHVLEKGQIGSASDLGLIKVGDGVSSWSSLVAAALSVPSVINSWAYTAHDGATDDTANLQAAINATPLGGTCLVPAANYLIQGQLSVPSYVALVGMSPGPFDVGTTPAGTATVLAPTFLIPNTASVPVAFAGRSSLVSDLLFYYPNQIAPTSASAPTVYPATFSTISGSAGNRIQRCTLANSYVGFSLFGGRHIVENCYVGALSQPFTVDHSLDVIRLSHIQCTPFWNNIAGLSYPQTIDTWVGSNQTVLQVARADGMVLNDFFAFHGSVGINLIDGTDSPAQSYGFGSNVRLDTFSVGVRAQSTQVAGDGWVFSNLGVNASSAPISMPAGGAGSPIITVRGGAFWGAAKVPSNAAGGTYDIKGVRGFNPVGTTRLIGGQPGVPGSTVAYTNNTGVDCTHIITTGVGVTVSVIAIGGVTTGLTMAQSSVSSPLRIPAGQTITLTYAGGTPTWEVWGD